MASKRVLRCTQVGGAAKRRGHAREAEFHAQFGDTSSAITYKAEADARITCRETLSKLSPLEVKGNACSLKSSNNIQFTLGSEILPGDDMAPLYTREFWEKHLAKTHSENPADFMVYRSDSEWIFFSMKQVIDTILTHTTWRKLDSGRIKGDVDGKQYLTYEYRKTSAGKHKGYFLGANCGKGKAWIRVLMSKIPSISLPVADK